jgi:hypothetical protein
MIHGIVDPTESKLNGVVDTAKSKNKILWIHNLEPWLNSDIVTAESTFHTSKETIILKTELNQINL